jgi:hypothetical protein
VVGVERAQKCYILHEKVENTCKIRLAFDPKKAASIMNLNGHGLCKRLGCSGRAIGVEILDAT